MKVFIVLACLLVAATQAKPHYKRHDPGHDHEEAINGIFKFLHEKVVECQTNGFSGKGCPHVKNATQTCAGDRSKEFEAEGCAVFDTVVAGTEVEAFKQAVMDLAKAVCNKYAGANATTICTEENIKHHIHGMIHHMAAALGNHHEHPHPPPSAEEIFQHLHERVNECMTNNFAGKGCQHVKNATTTCAGDRSKEFEAAACAVFDTVVAGTDVEAFKQAVMDLAKAICNKYAGANATTMCTEENIKHHIHGVIHHIKEAIERGHGMEGPPPPPGSKSEDEWSGEDEGPEEQWSGEEEGSEEEGSGEDEGFEEEASGDE